MAARYGRPGMFRMCLGRLQARGHFTHAEIEVQVSVVDESQRGRGIFSAFVTALENAWEESLVFGPVVNGRLAQWMAARGYAEDPVGSMWWFRDNG